MGPVTEMAGWWDIKKRSLPGLIGRPCLELKHTENRIHFHNFMKEENEGMQFT
jgi:hypothetical protein